MTNKTKRSLLLAHIAIIILGFGLYSNSLNGKFVWDDTYLVKDNRFIYDYSNALKIFTQDTEAGSGGKSNFYRPLQIFSYMVDYSLWKLDVRGYHFTNILLHIGVSLSLFWLINIIFDDCLLSLLTSIFFVIHPIHTEVVAYISGRADSLAVLFMLLCFILYIKQLKQRNATLYILMLFSFVLALLSRENSLILPILLLLYHYCLGKKLKVKGLLSILSLAVFYIILRLTLLRHILIQEGPYLTLLKRIPGFFVAITNYLRLLVLPFKLHMEYGNRAFGILEPKAIMGIFLLFSLLIYGFTPHLWTHSRINKKPEYFKDAGFTKRKTNPFVFFSLSWLFLALLPVSGLFPLNAFMAEHWLYLPSIGFFLILAKCLSYLCELKKFFRPFALIFAIALLVFYSALTIKQNNYWKDPLLFYERTLKFAPNSQRVYNNLGNTYKEIGRPLEALEAYKKALEVDPNSKRAYNNLGVLYKDIGEYEESVKAYKKAIEIDVNYSEAYTNLGVAYKDMDKQTEAIASFKTAIEKNPDFAQAHNNLAALYITIGKDREAIPLLEKAIKINSQYAEAYNNLAVAYYVKGDYAQAIQSCDRAAALGFKIHPKFLELLKQYRR